MEPTDIAKLSINGDRLWSRLMEMAKIGATKKGGVCRLALTDLDKQSRDLFCQWATDAGCTIEIDDMGNIFARRQGEDQNALPVASGSHLDSQPTGGKYDGVVGVLAALEAIDSLNDHGVKTVAPVEAVVWTNEEGARFTPAMIGSGVFVGEFEKSFAYGRSDKSGASLGAELERIGYKGPTPCGARKLGAHIELHIEQGPILEAEGVDIGVLSGVQGVRWYDLTVVGAETHAGPSPMASRRDPVPAFAAIAPQIYEIAAKAGEEARCTMGIVNAMPGSTNTVPGRIKSTVDLRHPDENVLARMNDELHDVVARHNEGVCDIKLEQTWYMAPVVFDETCVNAISDAATICAPSSKKMVSGAGHDSVYISRVAPTGMIFIPCKNGLSHNEAESTELDQVRLGGDVLLNAITRLAGVAE